MKPQEHFTQNIETFQVWIDTNADLQPSNDLISPLIEHYETQNPGIKVGTACRECIIDMLRWYKMESKEPKKEKNDTKPSNKPSGK